MEYYSLYIYIEKISSNGSDRILLLKVTTATKDIVVLSTLLNTPRKT